MADMRVKIDGKDKAWSCPDVKVTCNPEDRLRNKEKDSPLLIVEVLSPSIQDYDRGGKFGIYRLLDCLREYVLIDPTSYLIEVFRLNGHQRFELFSDEGTDNIVEFTGVGLKCAIADFYEDVVFT
jgi:Uma2 family endonuclease